MLLNVFTVEMTFPHVRFLFSRPGMKRFRRVRSGWGGGRSSPEVGVVLHERLQVVLYVGRVLLRDDVAQVVSGVVEPLVGRLLARTHKQNAHTYGFKTVFDCLLML